MIVSAGASGQKYPIIAATSELNTAAVRSYPRCGPPAGSVTSSSVRLTSRSERVLPRCARPGREWLCFRPQSTGSAPSSQFLEREGARPGVWRQHDGSAQAIPVQSNNKVRALKVIDGDLPATV